MNRWAKLGVVAGGYLLAIVAGVVAGWLYDRRMAAMPFDTSGGMYAGGEALTSLAAFLLVALAPTVLGLWFVRRHARLWQCVAALSLAFAIAGLIAMLTSPLIAHDRARHPALLLIDLLWVAQLLGVPLWTLGFVLFAFLAPTRPARRLLVAAIGVELVIAVCAAIHWFLPGSRI